MRLIDADALMADLEKWLTQIDPTHPPEDNAIPPMEDIIVSTLMTIEEQQTIEPPKWIPVTEALPEDACQCIVTAKVKHVDNYPDYEVDTADFADGIFTTNNSWWGVESIIAWMPLPEPYKEGQND